MKDISITLKLILSFGVIAFIVFILSAYTMYNTLNSADNFTRYREMAKDTVLASRVQANMLMVRMNVKDYLKTVSDKDIEEFNYYYNKTADFLKEALVDIKSPARAPMVREIDNELKVYKKDFYRVTELMDLRNDIVHNNLDINGKEVEQLLTSVSISAQKDDDTEAALEASKAIRSLLLARLYTAKYLASNKQTDASRARTEFINLAQELVILNQEIQNPKRSAQLKKAVQLVEKYEAGVAEIVNLIKTRNRVIYSKLNVIGPKIAKLSEEVKLSVKKDQDTIGPEVANLNESLVQIQMIIFPFLLLFILFMSIFVPKYIKQSLLVLHEGIKNLLLSSDIRSRVAIQNNDEIGAISRDFNSYLQILENNLIEDEKLIVQAGIIAKGDYEVRIIPRYDTDTLGQTLQSITESLRRFTQVVESIASGVLDVKVDVKGDDDNLAIAVNIMIDRLQNIAEHADNIAQGNYQEDIQTKSKEDILGIALQNMTYFLRENAQSIKERDWLQDGQAQMDDILREDTTNNTLSKNILNALVTYTNAQIGIIYVYNEKGRTMDKCASYASLSKEDLSFKLGEGVVGQSAKERKSIVLQEVPDNYLTIESGVGVGTPTNIIVLPFSYRGNIHAVVELGYFDTIHDELKIFLEGLRENIGIAYESIFSKTRLNLALEESQVISESLQAQEEELKVSNEKLVYQSSQLQMQKDTLEKSKRELEAQAEELISASQYKSEFLANMSHELRTPLNSLLILSRALAENDHNNLSVEEVESAQVIQESGKHLLSLINDILDISKIEAGQMGVHLETINTDIFLNNINKRFMHMAKDKDLVFEVLKDETFPEHFLGDTLKMDQILTNLIANAIKFTDKGSVNLNVKRDDNILYFAVKDTGIGIPKDKQGHIFEAFKQADGSTTRNYGGTGLGLSIATNFSKVLEGGIDVDSDENKGSTFTLHIPYSASRENQSTEPVGKIFTPLSFEDDRQKVIAGKNIYLIVEDDERFAKIIYELCHERGDLALVANNGEEGLALAMKYSPDGIILDYMLPGINGVDVLSILKTNEKTKKIPVHLVSAVDKLADMKEFGAVSQLKKPISKEQISTMLNHFSLLNPKEAMHVLVIGATEESIESQRKLLKQENIELTSVQGKDEGIRKLTESNYTGLILDFDTLDGCEFLLSIEKSDSIHIPPIVVYSSEELTKEEEKALEKYTSGIIIKSLRSDDRLLDEVKLFIHHTKTSKPIAQNSSIDFEGKTVLLVDDDMRNTYSLAKILRQKNMKVYIASSAQDALKQLEDVDDVDMLLSDIMMPEMDGYELIKRVREQAEYKDLPIAALTANAMQGDKQKCLDAGANDYLAKPIDIDALFVMIKMWL